MSDFLMRLAERALGTAPAVQPLFGSRFGDDAGGGSGFTEVDAEHEPAALGLASRPAALPAASPSALSGAGEAGIARQGPAVPALSRTAGPVLQRYAASGDLATPPSIAPLVPGAAEASASVGDGGVGAAARGSASIDGAERGASAPPAEGDVAASAAGPLVPHARGRLDAATPFRSGDEGLVEVHAEIETHPRQPGGIADGVSSAGAGAQPPRLDRQETASGDAERPAGGRKRAHPVDSLADSHEVHAETETAPRQPDQGTASGDADRSTGGRGRVQPIAPLVHPRTLSAADAERSSGGEGMIPRPAGDASEWGEIASEIEVDGEPTGQRRTRPASSERGVRDSASLASDAASGTDSAEPRRRSAASESATARGVDRSPSAENAGEAGAQAGQGSAPAADGGTGFADDDGAEDGWLVPVNAELGRRAASGDPGDGFELVEQEVEDGLVRRSSRTTTGDRAFATTGDAAAARAGSSARAAAAHDASTAAANDGAARRASAARLADAVESRGIPLAESSAEPARAESASRSEAGARSSAAAAMEARAANAVARPAPVTRPQAREAAPARVPSAESRTGDGDARTADVPRIAPVLRSPGVPVTARETAPARSPSAERRTDDGDARTADAPGTALAPRPRGVPVTASAAPLSTRAPQPQPSQQPERPIVHVTIGRIEVRASTPPAPQPQPQAAPGWTPPVLTLDEYLKRGGNA